MGNGPQTATFLDWGKGDWLKKMKKRNFTNTQFKPSLSFSLFFKMVIGGWINRAIHYQGEERKGKSCLFKGYWAMRKGLRRLFADLEGWISLSESRVKTERKRETLAVFTGPQTERLNWLTVQKCNDLLHLSQAVPRKFEINNNAIRTENQILNVSLDICCRMTFAFLMNC